MRRAFVRAAKLGVVIVLAAIVTLSSCSVERFTNRRTGAPLPPVSERAEALHRRSVIADLHADSLLWRRDLAERSTVGHVDVPRLREGNVALQVLTVVSRFPISASIVRTSPHAPDLITMLALVDLWPARTLGSLTERVLYQASKLEEVTRKDDHVRWIRSRADLDRLLADRAGDRRLVGVLLGIEGAHALDRPSAFDEVVAAGVRLIGLAHFFDDDFAGSAHGVDKGGLTPAGRALVARMEQEGIVVDLAHSSPRTIEDVLAIATKPPVVSHTGVRATCDNPRNLSDDQLRAVAARGGVVGIGDWPTAVCGGALADIARAIRHAVDVIGDDHVALGSDFDGAVAVPFDASRLDVLTQAMLDAGLPESSVARVLGENAVRVLRATLRPS